jgi:hypothetical protein
MVLASRGLPEKTSCLQPIFAAKAASIFKDIDSIVNFECLGVPTQMLFLPGHTKGFGFFAGCHFASFTGKLPKI